MNKNKKKRKGFNATSMRCPYCGSTVVYRSADGIYHENKKGTMLYVCSNFPECDAYDRVHAGTNIPVGSLANHELRSLRRTAHHYFDQLHLSGYMSKQDAYKWLADLVMAPMSEAHIGHIRLILVLPCFSQTRGWSQEDIEIYDDIKQKADKVVYTSQEYTRGCMHKRNRHLVDNSSACISYLTENKGGTFYTVNYAKSKGVEVINIAE